MFAARGEVFTVPAKDGSVRNLTNSPGVREQKVAWSPNGQWIAYISDRTGEDEIYIVPQDGLGPEEQITSGHKGFMFQPQWSPDSSKIAWGDQELRLWYIDIKEKKPVQVDRAKYGEIHSYTWSPDSQWLAYDKQEDTGYSIVYLYGLPERKITPVTSPLNNSFAPVFDPEKRYLYFLSDRDFNEVLGNVDFEFANPKTTRAYLLTLTADEPSPFPALSDETKVKSEEPESTSPHLNPRKARIQNIRQTRKKRERRKRARNPRPRNRRGYSKSISMAFRTAWLRWQLRRQSFAVSMHRRMPYGTTPINGLSGPIPEKSPRFTPTISRTTRTKC